MGYAWAGGKPVRTVAACLLLWAGAILPARAGAREDRALLARGDYLVHIMDCSGCHTYGALAGPPDMTRFLGGSDTGFEIPGLGVFYPPNLTPDRATGLGRWRRADIVLAIRSGKTPDGRTLAPAMPWRSYSRLTPHDALAVATYLKSLKPIHYQVPGPFRPGQTPTQPYLTRTGAATPPPGPGAPAASKR